FSGGVRLPRLAVVVEATRDDPLEVHPQVEVVVLVHVPRRRGAGGDDAALAGHIHTRSEGLTARVLEDDVDVVPAGELTDALAEALPLLGVLLGPLLVPELVVLLAAVDDVLRAHTTADLGLVRAGDHADGLGATGQGHLGR